MLKDLINRLKEEGRWGYIENAFMDMQKEIIEDMRSGKINEMEKLIKANAKLELLERLINLEFFRGR